MYAKHSFHRKGFLVVASKNEAGEIIGSIAVCAVLIKVAVDYVNESLADQPLYQILLLLALAFVASASLFNDAKTILGGGVVAACATIFGYFVFDQDSLPLLVVILVILIVIGIASKIYSRYE